MPLGQGMTEMLEAVRDRIEVSGHGSTWQVTAGSFEDALGYARERFEDPAVLARADRNRWWPRVTLTVTTDPLLAASAPPLDELVAPVVPPPPVVPEPSAAALPASDAPWADELTGPAFAVTNAGPAFAVTDAGPAFPVTDAGTDAAADAMAERGDFAGWESDAEESNGSLPWSLEVIFASQEREYAGIPTQRGRHRA